MSFTEPRSFNFIIVSTPIVALLAGIIAAITTAPYSRLVRTQNRELSFRYIVYNVHRLTNLVILVMIST